jgi:hypothetical protein
MKIALLLPADLHALFPGTAGKPDIPQTDLSVKGTVNNEFF